MASPLIPPYIERSIQLFLGIFVLGVYAYFIWYLGGEFPVLWSDEWLYLINAKSFYEWGSFQASMTYDGLGSYLFGADSHGPFYPLFHGAVALVFSWNPINFLWVNLFLFILSILGFWFSRASIRKEWILFFILHPIILFYSFSLMQELIHVFGAMIGSLLILRIAEKKEKRQVISFLAFILFMSLFRSSWMVWGIALLPFFPKRFSWLSKLGFGLLLLGISLGIQLLITEQVPTHFSHVSSLLASGNVLDAFSQIGVKSISNLFDLLVYSEGKAYYLVKIGLLGQFISLIFLYLKRKSNLLQAGVLLFGAHLILLFSFHQANAWIELRIFLAPGIFLSFLLFREIKKPVQWLLIGFQFITFLGIISSTQNALRWRLKQKSILTIVKEELILSELKELPAKDEYWIQIAPEGLQNFYFEELPLRTSKGSRINYIAPYYTKETKKPDLVLYLQSGKIVVE
ncbi:MAG: hypothetical protein ACQEW9_03245 [Bacteroidota bacterium]